MNLGGEVLAKVEHDEEFAQELGTHHKTQGEEMQEERKEKRFRWSKQQVVMLI